MADIKHHLTIAAIALGVIIMLIVSSVDTLLKRNIPTRSTVARDESLSGFDTRRGGISSDAQNAKGVAELMKAENDAPDGRPAAPSGTGSPGLRITDTLDAATITIIRHALGQLDTESIGTDEAAHRVRRAKRIAQCARYGVPLATLASPDLDRWARRLGVTL